MVCLVGVHMFQPRPKREQAASLLSLWKILPHVQDSTPDCSKAVIFLFVYLDSLFHTSGIYL